MGQAASSFAGSRRRSDACDVEALVEVARKVSAQLSRCELGTSGSAPDINEFSIFQEVDPGHKEELLRLARGDVRARRAMGALVGLAVADSVGAALEFVPVGQEGSYFDPKTLQTFGQCNRFGLKPGQWTDDTSMGLCIADSLLVCGGYDGSDIRVRLWNWWNRCYNNAFRHDESRSDSVGLGANTSLSLMMVGADPTGVTRPRFEGLGEDSGNGSVIRLAPVPIFFHACDEDLLIRVSAESSRTTHPGSSASDACAFLGFVVARAISRPTVRSLRHQTGAAQFLDGCVAAYLARPEVGSQPALRRLLLADEPVGSQERCWNWRDPKGPFLQETMASRGKIYNGYPVDADYFGSYSMDGLAMALHSVYHTKSFTAAVARCVNFLGDADSTGAVCGQIAGAFYGLGAIDPRLLEQLGQWDPDSEIALRGALLYALGLDLSPETKEAARERSSSALACDRDEAAEAAELASLFPKPPPLPIDAHPVQQPPKSHSPPLIQGTAAMQAAIYAASMRAKDPNWGSAGRRKDEGLLACTLNADRGQRAPRRKKPPESPAEPKA